MESAPTVPGVVGWSGAFGCWFYKVGVGTGFAGRLGAAGS